MTKKIQKMIFFFFDGATFAGRKTSFIRLVFFENKFHTGTVFFKPSLEDNTIEFYTDINNELRDKYKITPSEYKNFKYPYEEGDGHEITAIKLGKASYSTFWEFNRSDDNDIKNYLTLKIDEKLFVLLTYQDGKIVDEYTKKEKSKSADDY